MGSLNNQIKKYNVTIPKLFETILNLNPEQQEKVLKYAEQLFFENKRIAARKACNIAINYARQNHIYIDQIKNISKSGVFLKTHKFFEVGEEIIMTFNMEGYDRPIKSKGRVVHATREGVGVEFKDISPYISQMIETLVDRMK